MGDGASFTCDGVPLLINGVLTLEGEKWVDKPGAPDHGDNQLWPPPGWPYSKNR